MYDHVKQGTARFHQLFECLVSMRYHRRRQGFFERTDGLINLLNLVAGSAAFVAFTATTDVAKSQFAIAIGGFVLAVVNAATFVFSVSRMAWTHAHLHDQFSELVERLVVSRELAPDELDAITSERLAIERTEPTAKAALQDLVYIEVCRYLGTTCDVNPPTGWAWATAHIFAHANIGGPLKKSTQTATGAPPSVN